MKGFFIDVISHAAILLFCIIAAVLFLATVLCAFYGATVLLDEGVCTWRLPVGIVCIALEWGAFNAIEDLFR